MENNKAANEAKPNVIRFEDLEPSTLTLPRNAWRGELYDATGNEYIGNVYYVKGEGAYIVRPAEGRHPRGMIRTSHVHPMRFSGKRDFTFDRYFPVSASQRVPFYRYTPNKEAS